MTALRGESREPGVVRGGSWYDRPKRAHAGCRLAYEPWQPVFNVGFRVACPAQEAKVAKNDLAK